MGTPYLSEIRIFSFNFAPKNWAMCNGQTLAINQNQALFALLGTTYGGNGSTNFALPNLQGRTGLHFGTQLGGPTYTLGQKGGQENYTLLTTEIPAHNHIMVASSNAADQPNANGNLLAKGGTFALFHTAQNGSVMGVNTIANAGGSQGHPNLPPYLVVNFCIALSGIFPSRN